MFANTLAPSPAPPAQVDTTPIHQHHAQPAPVAKLIATTAIQLELELFGVGIALTPTTSAILLQEHALFAQQESPTA